MDDDWVFASKQSKGKMPRSASIAAQNYLRPAAVAKGVILEGVQGALWLAQPAAFAGDILRRQRCQLAGDPEHPAALETVSDRTVHAQGEHGALNRAGEIP
jgi:hypothetical protein